MLDCIGQPESGTAIAYLCCMENMTASHALSLPGFAAVSTQAKTSVAAHSVAFWALLAGAPLVTYGAVARRGSRATGALAAGGVALSLVVVRSQMARWFSEEPAYRNLWKAGELSVREYRPQVLATTLVDASDIHAALEAGFERVGGYIFGGNAQRERLGMTSPVTASPRGEGRFEIAFVMPVGRPIESLPQPDDEDIVLRAIPTRYVAASRFAGRFSSENIESHIARFRKQLAAEALAIAGEPTFSGFDAPMTLPFLRRNEICAELAV